MPTPTYYFSKLSKIPLELLQELRISLVLVDMDNTVVLWKTKQVDDGASQWIKSAVSQGINVVLVTNSNKRKAEDVAAGLGIACLRAAGKPTPIRVALLLEQLKVKKEATLVVGDQLFTDIALAKQLGVKSVLVEPLSADEWWCTRVFNRTRERLAKPRALKKMRKNGQKVQ